MSLSIACIPLNPGAKLCAAAIAADFARGLALWLQGYSCLPVRLAEDGDELKVGEVLLAGTDDHVKLRSDRRLVYTADPEDYPYRPSVDVFFHSLVLAVLVGILVMLQAYVFTTVVVR